jgi:DNA polymerase-3 subunit alpha
VDFADNRREDVIQHIIEKYGHEHVAGIGTYGYMWAKGAIRNAGRALVLDIKVVDKVAKLIPADVQGKGWHVDKALAESKDLKDLYDKDPVVKNLVDWAQKIDGTIGNRSQHASAFCISATPISEL